MIITSNCSSGTQPGRSASRASPNPITPTRTLWSSCTTLTIAKHSTKYSPYGSTKLKRTAKTMSKSTWCATSAIPLKPSKPLTASIWRTTKSSTSWSVPKQGRGCSSRSWPSQARWSPSCLEQNKKHWAWNCGSRTTSPVIQKRRRNVAEIFIIIFVNCELNIFQLARIPSSIELSNEPWEMSIKMQRSTSVEIE